MNYSIVIMVEKHYNNVTVRDILELANDLLGHKDISSIMNATIKFKEFNSDIDTDKMKQLLTEFDSTPNFDDTTQSDDIDITFD